MRAGQPCAVASDGMTIHTSTSTPGRAEDGARDPVPRGQRVLAPAELDGVERAEGEAERLADRRDEQQEQHRDGRRGRRPSCRRTR